MIFIDVIYKSLQRYVLILTTEFFLLFGYDFELRCHKARTAYSAANEN